MMWDVQKLLGQLPQPVVTILRQATPTLLEQMTEIRLRSGQPLVVTVGERTLFLSKSGTVVPAEQGFIIPQELVQETMLSLCGHSLHGIEKTLEQGFFTAQGGFRIGACMQPYAARQGRALSLCIRLPREVIGAASDIYSVWQCSQGLILAGPPASGKTTILRDLCRLISSGEGGTSSRTVLLDERNELSGWDGEKCAFQLGPCTDILSGLPKAEAIRRATRTLSPQVILCDEIADEHEAAAIQYAFFCGVHFVVTVHCGVGQEPFYNAMLRRLMQTGAFSHLYLLGLPVGEASGTVVTRDEYDRKAAGLGAGFGRMYDDGIYSGGAAAQIAAALAERSAYREWTFAQQLASQPEADFGMALIDIMQNTALPEAFQKAMMPLAEVLGSTTMEVEKQALIGALMALRQEEKYWTEQENRQGTLFRRLGMLGGLALVVLLI